MPWTMGDSMTEPATDRREGLGTSAGTKRNKDVGVSRAGRPGAGSQALNVWAPGGHTSHLQGGCVLGRGDPR